VGQHGALPMINFVVELPVLDDPQDIPLDLLSLHTYHLPLGEPEHLDHSVVVEDLFIVQEAEDALGDQLLPAALVGVGVEKHGGPLRVEVAHALVLALLEPDQGAAVGEGQLDHALAFQDDLAELAYIERLKRLLLLTNVEVLLNPVLDGLACQALPCELHFVEKLEGEGVVVLEEEVLEGAHGRAALLLVGLHLLLVDVLGQLHEAADLLPVHEVGEPQRVVHGVHQAVVEERAR